MKEMMALVRGKLFSLKCRLFRKNIVIGRNLRIYGRLYIVAAGKVTLGDNCRIRGMVGSPHKFVCIEAIAPEAQIRIGNNAELCAARIMAKFGITIGDDVIVEDASILDTDFHSLDRSRVTPKDENADRCRIRIGSRVGIGALSFITKGVEIGDDVFVAPSAVVNKSIRPGHVAYGNPVMSVERDRAAH